MNKLHQELSSKGVLIVGVSDETEDKLTKYIASKNVRFPILRAPGASDKYGVKAFPTFVTIGPSGKVIIGNRMPGKGALAKTTKSIKYFPDLSSQYSSVRKDWKKRKFSAVLTTVTTALQGDPSDQDREVLTAIKKTLDARVQAKQDRITTLSEGPDYYQAMVDFTTIQREYAGLPVAAAATDALAKFADDAAIKKEIKAGKKLAKLRSKYDASKFGDRKKLIQSLRKFSKKLKGTHAAEAASDLVTELVSHD